MTQNVTADLSEADIIRLRSETAGCHDLVHFNNAGASLSPNSVHQAVVDHLELERQIGGYEAAAIATPQLASFYDEFAALLNCKPSEIAYVENATRAWDMAFYGLDLREGDRILTHSSEYASNYLAFLHMVKQRGIIIDLVPSDSSGQIDVTKIEMMITPRTRLIAITHAPTQGGLVNPAEEIGKVARAHGLIYILDACQSVGQIDLDVQKIGCDILTGTGRKYLRGPRGTGFLYISDKIVNQVEPPFIDMRAATWSSSDGYEWAQGAKRFENWESYIAGRIGLAKAVSYARSIGVPAIQRRVCSLAQIVRDRLTEEAHANVYDVGVTKCGTVTFTVPQETAEETSARLRHAKINTSVSGIVAARADFETRSLPSMVRASVHYFNTEKEVERFIRVVAGVEN